MIMKDRRPPHLLDALPRLLHRIPPHHASYPKILDHLQAIRAGFGGEQHVDEVLKTMRWPTQPLLILDLNFFTGVSRCQIDTLVMTPHFALILEIKNYSGTLHFHGNQYQIKRITRDGQEQGFDSPASQVKTAVQEIETLFRDLAVSLPVYGAVVLPYAKTLVEGTMDDVPVVFAKSLRHFIAELPRGANPMRPDESEAAAKAIAARHLPFYPTNYQLRYGFGPADLVTGVLCPLCGKKADKISQRQHFCSACGQSFANGYQQALADWYEFVSPEIKNWQCQRFLELKDKHASYYLLKRQR